MSGAASLTALGDLLRGLGGSVGQLVSCYVRAASGPGATDWTYFLLPFGTAATPLPVPVWFDGPGPGVAVNTRHAVARATVDAVGLAAGTTRATLDLDLTSAPVLAAPRLQIVVCTERSILVGGGAAPARLAVAVIDVRAPTTAGLPSALRLAVTLPAADGVTTQATVAASVTPRAGQTTAPLRAALVDGPVVDRPALFSAEVGADALPLGLGGLLDPILADAGLTITQQAGAIHTVETDGPVTGMRVGVDAGPATPGAGLEWSVDLVTPWNPGARPAVVAQGPGGGVRARYAVAALRTDGTESPPGATSAVTSGVVGSTVDLTLPPAPAAVAAFAGWRLYRSRLEGSAFAPPVAIGDHPASAILGDVLPASDPADPTRPVPVALDLTWHGPPAPDPSTLHAAVDLVDEEIDLAVPPARPTTRITADLTLPAAARLDLRPARGTDTPTTVTWAAPAPTAAAVHLEDPRSGLDVRLDAPAVPTSLRAELHVETSVLTTLAWTASAALAVTGSAMLPGADGARTELSDLEVRLPAELSVALRVRDDPPAGPAEVTDVAVGWSASASASPMQVRVTEHPPSSSTDSPLLTDARLEHLPATFAAHLQLPAEGAQDPPLLVDIGEDPRAPVPGTVPTEVPSPDGDSAAFGPVRLVRRPLADPRPPLPTRGPGPGLAVDVRSDLDALRLLDVRATGLSRVVLDRAAGSDTDVAVLARLEPTAARIQLVGVADNGGPTTLQVRARRLGRTVDLRLRNRSGDHLDVDLGESSDGFDGLRILQESGGTSAADRPLGTHAPTGQAEVTSTVATLDRLGRGSAAVALHPVDDGSRRPLRLRASLDEGADADPRGLHLALRSASADGHTDVDVDVGLPRQVRAVVGGDAGTLGPDTTGHPDGSVTLHDPLGVFEPGWTGRAVRWRDGEGTIVTVPDETTLEVAASPGSATPREAPDAPASNWYRVVDDPGSDSGVRIHPSRPVRARVAVSAIPGWGLCGVTATPQVRVESEPDVHLPASLDAPSRGALGALSVRVAGLVRAAQSSWTGQGELSRLLGHLALENAAEVLPERPAERPDPPPAAPTLPERLPPPLTWLCADVRSLHRPNDALLVVVHQPRERPDLPKAGTRRTLGAVPREELGRDALRLRLGATPDHLRIRSGPGVLELDNDGPISDGHLRAEPALWFRSPAPFAEAGYGTTVVHTFPPRLVIASGSAMPDLGGGVDTGTVTPFGTLDARSMRTAATRIVVDGGDLHLGRGTTVAWDGPRSGATDPWAPPVPGQLGSGGRVFWSLSDVWFLFVTPTGSSPGELHLFTPGEPQGEGEPASALQVRTIGARVNARILKVKLGSRAMEEGRRAATEVADWPTELAAEIQMEMVEGAFAVAMKDLGILDGLQSDQTTAGHWWMCAYDAILPADILGGLTIENAQFGSSAGSLDLRDAPWDPYWA